MRGRQFGPQKWGARSTLDSTSSQVHGLKFGTPENGVVKPVHVSPFRLVASREPPLELE